MAASTKVLESLAGKKPDVLIRSGDTAWWVEVERSRKNAKDYAGLLNWLGTVAHDAFQAASSELLGEKVRWGKVFFICTPAFQAKLTRDLAAAGLTLLRPGLAPHLQNHAQRTDRV